MKRILIFLMAIVILTVTSPAFAAKRSIMELPLFERAVLIISFINSSTDLTTDTVIESCRVSVFLNIVL